MQFADLCRRLNSVKRHQRNILAMEGSRGLREVVPAQCHAPSLREFTVATGATAQTLQDIKLPDSAGL